MKRITFATLMSVLLLMTMGLGAVGAAPVNNPHAETFEIICNGNELEITVARGLPGFVVDSTQRGIPQAFSFQLVVDGNDVFPEPLTEGVGQGKKVGLQDRLVTCELEIEIDDPDELALIQEELAEMGFDVDLVGAQTVVFVLEVQLLTTPARR